MSNATELERKYQGLLENIRQHESVLVAFSGGVDSTFLLYAVKDSGVPYLSVTATSPTMPTHDREMTREMAREMEANHLEIQSGEMEDENFVQNPEDRCFYCKNDLFGRLTNLAGEKGYAVVADGSTTDDLGDYRPGFKAKKLHQVVSPIMESGLTKEDVRAISRIKAIKTWDKPASPCLSSRFPYGERIDEKGLRMVEQAEIKLRHLGFSFLRVRKQGDVARIEVPLEDFPRLMDDDLRQDIITHFKDLGFLYISLDLEGFQSGKLNRAISQKVIPIAASA